MFDVDGDEDGTPKLPSIKDVLGQLMGGQPAAAQGAPQGGPTLDDALSADSAPPAQPAQPKPDMMDQAMSAPAPTVPGAQSNMTSLNDLANVRPNIPAPPANPSLPGLMQQKAAVSTPIDRRDPQYKMGAGQRILGTAANFLNGAARNGVGPVNVGPGANNVKYSQDEEAREGKLSGLNSQIADQEKLDEMNRQAYQTAAQAQERSDVGKRNLAQADKYENAVDPKSIHQGADGKWVGTTYGGKEQPVDEPQYVRTAERKTTEDENTPAPGARPSMQKNPVTGQMQLMVSTKGGKLQPYTPKSVQEGAALGDPTSKALFYYQYRSRGGKDANNPEMNGLTPGEQRDFKDRTAQNDLQMKSLIKTKSDALLRPWVGVDTKSIDSQLADLQNQRDQVRNDIISNRKGGGKPSSTSTPPSRTSTQPPKQSKYSGYANDGQGKRIGYNVQSKQWEPVAGTQ